MKIVISSLAIGLLALTSNLSASDNAEKLFETKCMVCHVKKRPEDTSKLIAPPIMGALNHVKQNYMTKKEAVDFIVDYVLNPTREKAVCMPQNIKKFGLMPSQKGNVTKEELKEIASWLYDNFPPKGMMGMGRGMHGQMGGQMHKGMKGKQASCDNPNQQQKMMKANKQKGSKKVSPFLISKGLPHLTKLVKQNWDNLNLTEEQKVKLLKIRKETMSGVKEYAPKVMKLEKMIKKAIMQGVEPQKLYPKIEKLAQFKAELTKVHARCIYNTTKTLTKEQLASLLKK